MIIDVSSYQGFIDWAKVSKSGVTKVIHRSTTKDGELDTRLLQNYNGVLQNMNDTMNQFDVYKFTYERGYIPARIEAMKTMQALSEKGIHFDMLWLDLEGWGGRDYTKDEANNVIMGYVDACIEADVQLGLYFNYNYAKNIVDNIWRVLPLWIARYNKELGNVSPWRPEIWQYTSSGQIDGIIGNVDISKKVEV